MVIDSDPTESEAQPIEYARRTDVPMSTELVGAITAIDGRKPTEIDPLGWSIDLDAVDALTVDENDDLRITFSTNGYRVQIEGSRRILVRKAPQED